MKMKIERHKLFNYFCDPCGTSHKIKKKEKSKKGKKKKE